MITKDMIEINNGIDFVEGTLRLRGIQYLSGNEDDIGVAREEAKATLREDIIRQIYRDLDAPIMELMQIALSCGSNSNSPRLYELQTQIFDLLAGKETK